MKHKTNEFRMSPTCGQCQWALKRIGSEINGCSVIKQKASHLVVTIHGSFHESSVQFLLALLIAAFLQQIFHYFQMTFVCG